MSMKQLKSADKAVSDTLSSAQKLVEEAKRAAQQGDSLDSFERHVWESVRQIGCAAVELLLGLQGSGDLGPTTQTAEGQTLQRSEKPARCSLRSIFGTHEFQQYTYGAGPHQAIELRPIDARLSLPEQRWSYLLQEFSQMFCVESAFGQAAENLGTVFGGRFSVDTLEAVNQQMGQDAAQFLADLPTPPRAEEGAVLVLRCDGKGVPLVRDDAAKVPAFETAGKRPGNRRIACVASVYSVDRLVRTPA